MRVTPLVASRFRSDGGAMFGLVPKPVWSRLIPPDDRSALERALSDAVNHSETTMASARLLREHVRTNFSLDDMVEGGISAYRAALAARKS